MLELKKKCFALFFYMTLYKNNQVFFFFQIKNRYFNLYLNLFYWWMKQEYIK